MYEEHNLNWTTLKTATLLEDESPSLFICAGCARLYLREQGYPQKTLMMCCLLQGSLINLCVSRRFPSLFV